MSRFSSHQLIFLWILRSVYSNELSQNTGTDSGSLNFFYQRPDYPRDCAEATNGCSTSNLTGVYLIKPDGYAEPFEVYCDNTVDSGGWTVIQRLQDGSILFNRNWTEYKTGFGFLSQEFWLGNEKLSFLTNQNLYELRIDFTSADNLSFHVTYDNFRISDEYSEYKLSSVGEYSGTEDTITMFLCPSGTDGMVFFPPDCLSRCSCNGGQLSCDDNYQCSPNAVCEERNNILQCYCNAGYTGDGVRCIAEGPPADCQDIYDRGFNESGVYKIKPTTWPGEPFDAYCNITNGEGWTVFQRRVDGTQNFYLYWSHYQNGFGTPDHELWLGNDKLHSLTTQKHYELRIDFVNSLGDPYYAKYSSFNISSVNVNYRMRLGTYSGDAGDSLSYHNGQAFTTRDRDNDRYGYNCATYQSWTRCGSSCAYNGAWWYNHCAYSSLNSPYGSTCLLWNDLPENGCRMKYIEMKVRPI